MGPLFYFIHGTYAPRAAWTGPDSALSVALRASFGADCEFRRFDWDGKNSAISRQSAATRLAEELDAIPGYEERDLYIVAHSHGGNIAVNAIAAMKCPERLDGLITLGTPFLRVEPRASSTIWLFACSFALWLVLACVLAFDSPRDVAKDNFFFLCGIAVAVAVTLSWLFGRLGRSGLPFLTSRLQLISGDLPILCVTHGFDEAAIWLSLLGIPRFLERLLESFANDSARILDANRGLFEVFRTLAQLPYGELLAAPLLIVAAPIAGFAVAGAPLSLLGAFVLQHRFGFGGRFSFSSLMFHLSVHRVPWFGDVVRRDFSGLPGARRARRASPEKIWTPHSLGYADPKALAAVCDWIAAFRGWRR